jgi:predicted small metal-binding protein
MKQFSCADLGNNCNVVLMAQTEERLAELASLHLREVHEMISIPQDAVAQIKQLFINRATPDAAYVVDRIFEKYNCESDPECTWRYIAEAERILTGNGTVHSMELKAA